ncbi:hypothetical protein LP419_22805 [Massilia sp. H-1]|nr:hypothetical protein LP419_22805 [Massilia sp. H-1]
MHEAGGIYLDVDIMPYRAATAFLARPEVPDYAVFAPDPRHVCWMNLIDDENGMLVARRGTPILATMLEQMRVRLQLLARRKRARCTTPPTPSGATSSATPSPVITRWRAGIRSCTTTPPKPWSAACAVCGSWSTP